MARECCRAQVWPNGVFFADEVQSWDEVRENARRIEEIRYLPRWHPWNIIYRVTTAQGKEETYATYENVQNHSYRAWYRRQKELGLCVRCGRRATGINRRTGAKYVMCNTCRDKYNKTARG